MAEYFSGRITVAAWAAPGRNGEAGYHCKLFDGEVFWVREESFKAYFKAIPDPLTPLTSNPVITEDDL